MPNSDPRTVVSTSWLAERLEAPDIRILDASWYLPKDGRDAKGEYRLAHIPGAIFFDLDELSDAASPLPHMLPDPVRFASRMRKMGVGDGHRVIFYDGAGLFSAPRAWWMLRAMGHRDVAVLDGGLPKWIAEGRPVDDLPAMPRERHFTPRPNNALVRNAAQMRANLERQTEQVVDARSRGRFTGVEPEPRPGLRGGHIPGSRNVPYADVIAPDGTLKQPDALREVFAQAGVDLQKPVVTTCGSGVSAAILTLALARLGIEHSALYDGSWAEWGADPALPMAT